MGIPKLDKTTLNAITSLTDKPNKQSGYSAAQMKQKFTDNAETIADFINALIDELAGANTSTTYGSGAKNIGIASREEFSTYTNVEDVLVYYRNLIRQAVAGEIGDNDIHENHLNHASGAQAVSTGTIRDGAVTNVKLAGSITSDKIAGVLTSVLEGTISNSQLAGSISYDKLAGAIRASQLYGDIPADKLAGSIPADKLAGSIPLSKLVSGYVIPLANGGTGATTAANARTAIGLTSETWTFVPRSGSSFTKTVVLL